MPPKKKSGKGREKKLKRKQEQAENDIAWSKVMQAYEMGDFMEQLLPFKKFERNGISANVSYLTFAEMSKDDSIQWCFQLLKDNMRALYLSAGWGWKDHEKMDELTHESSRFILATDRSTSKKVGFISFRFDLDHGVEVLYCYEVQMVPEVRRKGLGKFLMQVLELISHRASMRKIVLTVFKENIGSNSFFRDKLGYTDDETSPSVYDPLNPEEYSYTILSKITVKKSADDEGGSHHHHTHGCCDHSSHGNLASPRT